MGKVKKKRVKKKPLPKVSKNVKIALSYINGFWQKKFKNHKNVFFCQKLIISDNAIFGKKIHFLSFFDFFPKNIYIINAIFWQKKSKNVKK